MTSCNKYWLQLLHHSSTMGQTTVFMVQGAMIMAIPAVSSATPARSAEFPNPQKGYEGVYMSTEQYRGTCTFVVRGSVVLQGSCQIAIPSADQTDNDCLSLYGDKDFVTICPNEDRYRVDWSGGADGNGQNAAFPLGMHDLKKQKISACFVGSESRFCYNLK